MALLAFALCALPCAAWAQGPTVDPGGAAPESPAPPPAAPQPPQTIIIPINPQTGQPLPTAPPDPQANADGFYHYDQGMGSFDQPVTLHAGPTPQLHVVRSGDTLWDICFYYFNDPWQWPKIWSYNEQITNPHWIYPGDLVRMVPRGVFVGLEAVDEPEPAAPAATAPEVDPRPSPARRVEVSLRQTAFVEQAELEQSIRIDGAVDAKELLSAGDEVYLTYPASRPPKVGKRYSVYIEGGKVASGGKTVGAYVRLLGTLEVRSVKKGKRARGVLLSTHEEIERGAKVGPLLTTIKSVPAVAAQADVQGAIVAMLSADQLIGQGEVVFLDIGAKSKVQVGNRLTVVRRGDAYDSAQGTSVETGQDDRRFPARAVGEVIVVEVGKNISIGLVTLSVQELGVGDLVIMQKAQGL
ncbi:MAG: LysM peptidoglycan-binding domain-containing protein [Myxococcales bacterium]|nr:LysM peptidoglycan-binding domain-containing protein [Myxococcales bacterium]